MQANRRRDTRPELAIRRLLHARGLRYRVDARPLPTVRHTADVIFTRARIAVFIDGCWWHGCADHYCPPALNAMYWAAKVARNRERDRQVDEALLAAGWRVIRIWEHESPEPAAQRIELAVRNHTDPAELLGSELQPTMSGSGSKTGAAKSHQRRSEAVRHRKRG